MSPGAVPLQEPQSPERSSHCHSDAGRCRARRGRCRMLAGCHCRGECPSGKGWKHQGKGPGSDPKVKIPLGPPRPCGGLWRCSPPLATGHLCSVRHGIAPRFSNQGLRAGTWHCTEETQSPGTNVVDLPASPLCSAVWRETARLVRN